MHMDKQITRSILVMLCSMRGTEIAEVEGLWLVSRPKCFASEDPDNSPEVLLCSLFIVPSLNSTRDPCDVISNVTIVCSNLPMGKQLCMHIRNAAIHLCICWHTCQNPNQYRCI